MARPVIHSIKHYVQNSLSTVVAGTVANISLLAAVAPDAVNTAGEVIEGSVVKAIYIESWLRAGSTTGSSGQYIIWKSVGAQTNPSSTNMAALHDWTNKKNIFYTTMGLFNDQDADAIAAFKGWIKIPKGKQRMGLGDQIKISIFAPTIDLHHCGFSTYKEYS